jgi:molecular chaperone DnaK (HSP70)
MKVRFSVGIDLGTSNSAIAVGDIESGDTKIVEIGQIVGPNQLSELPTLPSAIYVPHREEFAEGSFPLPWNDAGEPAIVGQFARDRGALVPDRLVTSAKSWLSNPHRSETADPALAVRHQRRETLTLRMLAPLPAASQRRAALRRAFAGTGLGPLGEPDRRNGSCLVR